MHDGPGVRTTVFLKGCPLRCLWCHNPETQKRTKELLFYGQKCVGCRACGACPNGVHSFDPVRRLDRDKCTACGECADLCPTRALEVCGKEMTVDQILHEAKKDLAFYGKSGGVTISGGEPFMQARETIELLHACKAFGIPTAVETCGFGDEATFIEAVPFTDLFLWDIKDTSPQRHKSFTGVSNETILRNLRAVDAVGGKTRLRCILVNGVNTDGTHYKAVAELAASLSHCEGVEWLPYHAYGGSKSDALGLGDNGVPTMIPSADELELAKKTVADLGIYVF